MHTPIRQAGIWYLLCIFPWMAVAGPERTPPLAIRATTATNVFVIGEPIPVVVEVTNRSPGQVGFSWQTAEDNLSGVSIELVKLENRNGPEFRGDIIGHAEGWIEPGGTRVKRLDLAQAIRMEEPGRYGLRVRYQDYVAEVEVDASGRQTVFDRKIMDIQSDLVEIILTAPDPELITKLDRLLASEADKDVEEALMILATARPGVYRKELSALWKAIRTRRQPVKNQALKLFLSRIELADARVPEEELFSELAVASTDKDPSLRAAVAASLYRMHCLDIGGQSLFSFRVQKVPKWFARETSPECRAFLVSSLPASEERLAVIVQQDADPQVRAAAIQRLVASHADWFLKAAGTFTNLAGQITVEGRSIPLRAFVEGEQERVRRMLAPDEKRESTPPSK